MPTDNTAVEIVRIYVLNLTEATSDMSLREVAALTGVDHMTIRAILKGETWPDALTIAKTERGFNRRLWLGPRDLS
ncbi:helix-turn-helix transcriptional regulator [Rothia amarae]|uniref:Helix-turn-helix transcriptional regulator n=1 Tax=Rothia amarae TaxID=169480 RepID=A0A7H2BJK2_9MICC|nr:helix-turn-helix transcriptional regulator [Rothia amarae]QNV39848.2 helix-turn-helix transcriptional regulator [Rothia amarae]